jgi:hypothetical protein
MQVSAQDKKLGGRGAQGQPAAEPDLSGCAFALERQCVGRSFPLGQRVTAAGSQSALKPSGELHAARLLVSEPEDADAADVL